MKPASDIETLDWAKGDGLLPAIIQHWRSGAVLMLGYMNAEALLATQSSGKITFFSRSRKRLWTKGESSGNFLNLKSLHVDCDADTILARAEPDGPTCHTGSATCFPTAEPMSFQFLAALDGLIEQRAAQRPPGSYTTRLFDGGVRGIAQKVGEEGVEMALAAVAQDDSELVGEAADLLFHLMVLLRARNLGLIDAIKLLEQRHAESHS
ncbi:bifunctional phosphoribosyl-AMP cyclohydrolase/phosphoribosyl-ATP diphosphatase HisIE [Dokdonella sp.]|uniref:bifunctional phosphoribosyl-AMP cyclohydrolase/phosphoribosyl-ATP diphosphatase HisIE n=1 Tax=Dokdonella sp. TaxID=2291710 RepID=UPI003C47D8C9